MSERGEAVENAARHAHERLWQEMAGERVMVRHFSQTLDIIRDAVEAGIKLGEERERTNLKASDFPQYHERAIAAAKAEGAREHADKLRTAIAENEMLQRQLGQAEERLKELSKPEQLESALLAARRFIWLHLLVVDGGAEAIRKIDASLFGREGK